MQSITKVFSDIVKPYIDAIKQALTQNINVNGSKNICPFEGTESRGTGGSTSDTMFSLDLAVGDKVTFVCTQDNAMSSNTRNTLQATLKTDSSVVFREDNTANYHLASGLHVLQFTVATAGTYNFAIWTHTLGTATTYSNFMVCNTDFYNIDPSYQPYAKSNRELTELTSQLALSVISGSAGTVFNISCNTPYARALVITPYSIGSIAYWSGTFHYIPLAVNQTITVTSSNESSTGLTLTFSSVVNVTIMSLTNQNDIWSGTKVS